MRQLYNCLENALNYILPHHCALCGKRDDTQVGVCDPCQSRLPSLTSPCPVCARNRTEGRICGACQNRPPAFDATIAAFSYREPVASLVHRLKYGHDTRLSRTLGILLAQRVAAEPANPPPTLLIPTPAHYTRLMGRGFNQALTIARETGKRLGVPVAPRAAVKHRNTGSQVRLKPGARVLNARDSFTVTAPLQDRRVALVDDVMTTGATLQDLARAARAAGASHVSCWVLARA